MEKIYIAFVDTPGLFASALHGYLKQKYIHVLLSLDENLDDLAPGSSWRRSCHR